VTNKTETQARSPELSLDPRTRILSAALTVFQQEGLNRATMRRVAQVAGFTTGAIYSQFEGKEEIYACLLEDSLDRLFRICAAAVVPDDAEQSLSKLVNSYVDFYQNRPAEFELALYLSSGLGKHGLGPERDVMLNEALLRTFGLIDQALAEIEPRASQQKVRHSRNKLVLFMIGLLTLTLTGRHQSIEFNPSRMIEDVVGDVLRAVQAG